MTCRSQPANNSALTTQYGCCRIHHPLDLADIIPAVLHAGHSRHHQLSRHRVFHGAEKGHCGRVAPRGLCGQSYGGKKAMIHPTYERYDGNSLEGFTHMYVARG